MVLNTLLCVAFCVDFVQRWWVFCWFACRLLGIADQSL